MQHAHATVRGDVDEAAIKVLTRAVSVPPVAVSHPTHLRLALPHTLFILVLLPELIFISSSSGLLAVDICRAYWNAVTSQL